MTKEELEKEAEENSFRYTLDKPWACEVERKQIMAHFEKGYLASAEPREKRIEELEEEISVLLSCKNCPENKGGFICVKEYENKCLAQKIQYIKELQEENENLKKTYRKQRNKRIDELQKENAELKETLRTYNGCGDWDNDFHTCRVYLQHEELQEYVEQLTKAKQIIKDLLGSENTSCEEEMFFEIRQKAERFISEVEK